MGKVVKLPLNSSVAVHLPLVSSKYGDVFDIAVKLDKLGAQYYQGKGGKEWISLGMLGRALLFSLQSREKLPSELAGVEKLLWRAAEDHLDLYDGDLGSANVAQLVELGPELQMKINLLAQLGALLPSHLR